MDTLDVVLIGMEFQHQQQLTTLLANCGWPANITTEHTCPPGAAGTLRLCLLGPDVIDAADTPERLQQVSGGTEVSLCLVDSRCAKAPEWLFQQFADLIFWPCSLQELNTRIARHLASPRPNETSNATSGGRLSQQMLAEFTALDLVGRSAAFVTVLEMIQRIAGCDATVLIAGETGTGKENVARAIHYLSRRQDCGFVPVNCGAIPDDLLESELFGHCKGAFTDAKLDRPGLVELANQGTLFLDEVDSLSAKAQAALLRFLQTREYRPLGGSRLKTADVRVLAASNANLKEKVAAGEFREDLLFRLNVLGVQLPPLRQRRDDIPLIAERLLARFAEQHRTELKSVHPGSMQWLQQQSWNGNVRELENTLLRGFLLSDGPEIRLDEAQGAPATMNDPGPGLDSFHDAKEAAINAFEHRYVTEVLRIAQGNVTEAAKLAGKERRALGKLIKKYNIDKDSFREFAFPLGRRA